MSTATLARICLFAVSILAKAALATKADKIMGILTHLQMLFYIFAVGWGWGRFHACASECMYRPENNFSPIHEAPALSSFLGFVVVATVDTFFVVVLFLTRSVA